MTDSTSENSQTSPTIELVDLQNAVKVIDYACEQGAFKGWQVIEQVMGVRGKLANFLQAAATATEASNTAQSSEPTEAVKPAVKKAPAKKTTKKN